MSDPGAIGFVNVAGGSPFAARTAFTAVRSSVRCTALICVTPATSESVNTIVVARSIVLAGPSSLPPYTALTR